MNYIDIPEASFGDLGSPAQLINSVEDHIHIVFILARTRSISEIVEEAKKGTSKWIKTKGAEFAIFIGRVGTGPFL